jgi:Peptidase M50B-like
VGRVARSLVASSGYLSAAVVGCLLMPATRVEKWAHVILLSLGIFMLLTLVLWVRSLLGFGVVLASGVALVTVARKGPPQCERPAARWEASPRVLPDSAPSSPRQSCEAQSAGVPSTRTPLTTFNQDRVGPTLRRFSRPVVQ